MRARFRYRIRIILAGTALIAAIVLVRLYIVQIVHGPAYSQKADQQFATGSSGLFDRGNIYFTGKNGSLISAATLATGFLIAINPQTLQNPEAAYSAIDKVASSTFTVSKSVFMADAAKKKQIYIEVAHHISETEGQAIQALGIPGIEVLRERWRYYPGNDLAAKTIGIVSYGSGNTLTGQTGLEAEYNSTLDRSGNGLYRNFFAELFSNVGNLLVNANSARQGNIITTIEPQVEARLQSDLEKVQKKYSSIGTGGIIMDPATGAIVAMASVPSYNANNLKNIQPQLLGNPLVDHVHEFGSIMKPITMASALDAGVITPSTTYNDTGCIRVDGDRICNWDYKARGVIPMIEIIKQSLNVGASWVATRLGQPKFRAYFTKLFGQKTGIDLPNEGHALLTNLSSTRQVDFDNMSFGQGIAVTPIQMIRALGAVANHGVMVQPHVVRAIQYDSGVIKTLNWDKKTRVFSAKAARETTVMMDALFDITLDHGKARIPTMSVAAKTGTAQLPSPTGGYYNNHFFHSFTGFLPSFNPRFIILLYTDDPKGAMYASETLAPTFLDLVHFLIDYYHIPPDRGFNAAPTGS